MTREERRAYYRELWRGDRMPVVDTEQIKRLREE